MKEKIRSNIINEKVIVETLKLLFSISLLFSPPNVSEVRQFVCSRLNLSFEDFSRIEKLLIRNGFAVRYAGRKIILTPKGVLYALYSEKHEC